MLGRNLYILAGTFGFLALACFVLAFTGIAHEPGAPTDAVLWRMIGLFLLLAGLIAALSGVMQHLFEQAERRDEDQRRIAREKRRQQ